MEKNKIITEDGIIAGNVYDKFNSKNMLVKLMMKNFFKAINDCLEPLQLNSIHEVGCGEGYLTDFLSKYTKEIIASDFSSKIIEIARKNVSKKNIDFKVADIFDLHPKNNDRAELIICSEVLEHLNEPERAIKVLKNIAKPYLLFSVPREPLWHFLNLSRLKYIKKFGNTPGHIQYWTKNKLVSLLKKNNLIIKNVICPIPWTIVLCENPEL